MELLAPLLLALIPFWIFADHAGEATFEQAKLRLAALYVSGLAASALFGLSQLFA